MNTPPAERVVSGSPQDGGIGPSRRDGMRIARHFSAGTRQMLYRKSPIGTIEFIQSSLRDSCPKFAP
jgi:hypothetical protein